MPSGMGDDPESYAERECWTFPRTGTGCNFLTVEASKPMIVVKAIPPGRIITMYCPKPPGRPFVETPSATFERTVLTALPGTSDQITKASKWSQMMIGIDKRCRAWPLCPLTDRVLGLRGGVADRGAAQAGPSLENTPRAIYQTHCCPDGRSGKAARRLAMGLNRG